MLQICRLSICKRLEIIKSCLKKRWVSVRVEKSKSCSFSKKKKKKNVFLLPIFLSTFYIIACSKIFLNISKLFDNGITGDLLSVLTNFLTWRIQGVVLNGQYSSWTNVETGFPQASIFGFLMFLIYINETICRWQALISVVPFKQWFK